MRKRKTYILVAVLLVAIVGMMGLAIGCGSSDTTDDASASPTDAAAITGSAMERATAILGREPTGLALDIVTAGEIVVANDSNYAPQSSVDPATKEVVGFDVDVANGMAEILGLGIKWKHPAWETIPGRPAERPLRRLHRLHDHHARAPAGPLDFTDPYYYTSGQIFVKKGGTQIAGAGRPRRQDGGRRRRRPRTTTSSRANTTANVKTYTTDARRRAGPAQRQHRLLDDGGPHGPAGDPRGQGHRVLRQAAVLRGSRHGDQEGRDGLDRAAATTRSQTMHENGTLTEMSKKWYNGIDLTVKE